MRFQVDYRRDFFRALHVNGISPQKQRPRRIRTAKAADCVGEFCIEAFDRDKEQLLPIVYGHSFAEIKQGDGHFIFVYLL